METDSDNHPSSNQPLTISVYSWSVSLTSKALTITWCSMCDSCTHSLTETQIVFNRASSHIRQSPVLEVAHDLLDKGYCLYLDNWYTSPKLVDTLCTRKHVVGTIEDQ